MMEKKEKIKELLSELNKLVPTIFFIGTTEDRQTVFTIGSPEKEDEERVASVVAAISNVIDARADVRDTVFMAVSVFMQCNPLYQAKMHTALERMKKNNPRGEA